jgi:hypothetical protein
MCVLYVFMLRRLLCGSVPQRTQQAESIRIQKRVTKMVVVVVVTFAICWLPFHAISIIQHFPNIEKDFGMVLAQLIAICFVYPILYAFLSDNFRQGFRKLLCCYYKNLRKIQYLRSQKYELNNAIDGSCRSPVSDAQTNESISEMYTSYTNKNKQTK